MSFADRYIQKNLAYPEFIQKEPPKGLQIIVVIPVYNEPELVKALDSLAGCDSPDGEIEVLLVINSGVNSPDKVDEQNKRTVVEVVEWCENHPGIFFNVHLLQPAPFIKKHAGAGMARKVGMDEAVRRFAEIDNPDGIIVSLDADTLVDRNYFVEIEKHFIQNSKQVAACISFKHRIEEIIDKRQRKGMALYEQYLHYYRDSLAFTGYPYAIHTVGSAFTVKVEAYVRQGGMNRKQAGEDFYFLHKLSQLGNIGEITTTSVYPSARISDRVPFGTGPVLQKWMDGDDSLSQTYRFQAFIDLKKLFDLVPSFFELTVEQCLQKTGELVISVQRFLMEDQFWEALPEIKANSSRLESFQKRFFQYFNAFKILKFLNFSHPKFYSFQNLEEADRQLRERSISEKPIF